MSSIQTPTCPLCGELPAIVMPGASQAFCGNESCTVFVWNPRAGLEQLDDAGVVDLTDGPVP